MYRCRALDRMKNEGIVTNHQIMDKKISAANIIEIKATTRTFQIVPLDDHHRNSAEKAIQTWKDHFIGVIIGTAADSPAHLWCQAIP